MPSVHIDELEIDEALVTDRFTGRFTHEGNTIDGHWELLDEHENWHPWMEITLTKQP
jgi:hypothetical protein